MGGGEERRKEAKMDVRGYLQKTITIIIKTPNHAQEDRAVEGVYLNWTIGDLKTHLTTIYPSKPAVTEQRLIYAGKLLPDYLHVRDLFRSTSQPHLSSSRPMAASVSLSPSSPSASDQIPSTTELRQRRQTAQTSHSSAHTQTSVSPPGTPTWPSAAMPGAPQVTQPAFPTYSLYSPQQLLWLQHIYARQYYMQYHAALAAAGTTPSAQATTLGQYPAVPGHHVQVPAPLANQNPIDNLQANQNPVQDGGFINPGGGNQNMRMNAQGGPVMEDEEDMERDWLDWLYTAARLGVLLMIVYFNSNLSRFLLVMGTLFLMYLHTAGWFRFRRHAQVRELNPVQPPEVQHNQQIENRNQIPYQDDERAHRQSEEPIAPAASDGPGPMTAVLVPPHRVSVMWTVWVFFKTFFSSLIPEGPQGLAN